MAHTFSITDGSTTITLNQANNIIVTSFPMEAPSLDFRNIDKFNITDIEQMNVSDSIALLFIGSSTSALQALIRSIEAMLFKSHNRQNRNSGPKVYLQVNVDGEAGTWRTEILNGTLQLLDNPLQSWVSKKVEANLIITRRFYYEGPEKELQLSNSNNAAATGGIEVYNHDDSGTGHDNYVKIAAAQISGVLPAPIKLTLQNTTGGNMAYRNIWLATNAFSAPNSFTHIIEGEDRVSGYGTVTTSSVASDGEYNAYSFTNTGEIHFSITSAQLAYTAGKWFRLLVRFFGWTGTDVFVQPILRDSSGLVTLWEADEIKLGSFSTAFQDLGSIPLPVGGYNTSYDNMRLVLKVRCTGSGSADVDFIQLTPLDSFQYFKQRGLNIIDDGTITVDNIEGLIHAGGAPIFSPRIGPLYVFPGVDQKIFILQDTGSASTIASTMVVRGYIRERRLSV